MGSSSLIGIWRRGRVAAGSTRCLRWTAVLLIVASAAPVVLRTPVAAVAAQGATEPSATAALAPEDAVMFFVADLDLESTQWRQARELLGRAGVPNAVDDLERTVLAELDVATTDRAVDLDPFYGGEVGLVVTAAAFDDTFVPYDATPAPAADAPAEGAVAILLPGDPDAAWSVVEGQLVERADEAGIAVERIEHRGVTIQALPEPADFSASPQAVARIDDAILIAQTAADLEPIVDVAAGEAAALAGFAPMADVRAELADEALLAGFVNGERLADALGADYRDFLDALNPDGPGSAVLGLHAGLALWADDPGFRLDTVARPLPGGTLVDLPDYRELTGAQRVSADALLFAAGVDLGVTGLLDALALGIAEDVAAADPLATPAPYDPDEHRETAAYVEERFAAAERVLGLDLRADLFDRFVGEYLLAVSVSDFFALGAGVSGIFASDLDQPATVTDAARRLARYIEARGAEDGSLDVAARRLEEGTVYVLRSPDETLVPPFEFGVVADQIVAGAGTGLDRYLEGPAEPLAEDEQFRRVLATLPAEHSQILYVDLSQIVPLLGLTAPPSVTAIVDADPTCGDYATQEEAQAAYEADPIANGALDQDFDDVACEDFFNGAATPAASPVPAGSYDAIEAFAVVAYEGEDLVGSSAILYIAEP